MGKLRVIAVSFEAVAEDEEGPKDMHIGAVDTVDRMFVCCCCCYLPCLLGGSLFLGGVFWFWLWNIMARWVGFAGGLLCFVLFCVV